MSTLYLTKEEKKLLKAIPEGLKTSWGGEVQEETGKSYETPEQLEARMRLVDFDDVPAVKNVGKDILESIASGKKIDVSGFNAISEEAFLKLLFCLGVRGISLMLESILTDADEKEALEAASTISAVRHSLLKNNSYFLRNSPAYGKH